MCWDVTVQLAPPGLLVCITGTLRWTGPGWRSRVSGANAFMLLIQLRSGVIPACQFVWAADLHNEFILASALHTPPSLPLSCSSVPLPFLVLQLLSWLSLHPPSLSAPLINVTECSESECLNANELHFQTDATAQACLTSTGRAPLRSADKRWMDGDDRERGRWKQRG